MKETQEGTSREGSGELGESDTTKAGKKEFTEGERCLYNIQNKQIDKRDKGRSRINITR